MDKTVIPVGDYCHRNRRTCPYWKRVSNKPSQSNGYCSYLRIGDWETDETSLLWDKCKECGEKSGEEFDSYDMSDESKGTLLIFDVEEKILWKSAMRVMKNQKNWIF